MHTEIWCKNLLGKITWKTEEVVG